MWNSIVARLRFDSQLLHIMDVLEFLSELEDNPTQMLFFNPMTDIGIFGRPYATSGVPYPNSYD